MARLFSSVLGAVTTASLDIVGGVGWGQDNNVHSKKVEAAKQRNSGTPSIFLHEILTNPSVIRLIIQSVPLVLIKTHLQCRTQHEHGTFLSLLWANYSKEHQMAYFMSCGHICSVACIFHPSRVTQRKMGEEQVKDNTTGSSIGHK